MGGRLIMFTKEGGELSLKCIHGIHTLPFTCTFCTYRRSGNFCVLISRAKIISLSRISLKKFSAVLNQFYDSRLVMCSLLKNYSRAKKNGRTLCTRTVTVKTEIY